MQPSYNNLGSVIIYNFNNKEHKCTKDGHECLSTFTYEGVTYKDECAPLIEDRTWCMYKEPKQGEKLTQGTHYDECDEKCEGYSVFLKTSQNF